MSKILLIIAIIILYIGMKYLTRLIYNVYMVKIYNYEPLTWQDWIWPIILPISIIIIIGEWIKYFNEKIDDLGK